MWVWCLTPKWEGTNIVNELESGGGGASFMRGRESGDGQYFKSDEQRKRKEKVIRLQTFPFTSSFIYNVWLPCYKIRLILNFSQGKWGWGEVQKHSNPPPPSHHTHVPFESRQSPLCPRIIRL